jgi:hypothetical protein
MGSDFINKNLSNNDVYKKFKERSDAMNNFFSGTVDIKTTDNTYKFYYAGREDTKSGQFYIFYIEENNPVILVNEETTFYIKEFDQTQTFAPRSVEIEDLNSDGLNEITLKGTNWGTESRKHFIKAYFLKFDDKKPSFNGIDYSVKIEKFK